MQGKNSKFERKHRALRKEEWYDVADICKDKMTEDGQTNKQTKTPQMPDQEQPCN